MIKTRQMDMDKKKRCAATVEQTTITETNESAEKKTND
jgi:hypothetical protein